MTVKEIILQYDKEYSANNELLNAVREFVEEKCKEQREICADYIRLWYDDKEIIRDIIRDILNTPLLNIFEESK